MGENICFADWADSISFLCLVVILDMYNLVASALVTYTLGCLVHLSMLCPTTPHPGNGGEYVGI